jgi:hypothetical protein
MDLALASFVSHSLRNSTFRRDHDHHANVIRRQMPLLDPALFLRGQLPENLTEVTPQTSLQ